MADKLITIRLDYTTQAVASGFDGMRPVTAGMIVKVEDASDE